MKKNFMIFFVIVILFSFSFGQTVIWSEDFESNEDIGATGAITPGTNDGVTSPSSGKWSINVANCNLSATTDWFKVTNQLFEARDIDGTQQSNGTGVGAVWTSESIPILGYPNVSISIDVSESGDHEDKDFIKASYQLDGGVVTQFGLLYDDFDTGIFSVSNLSGSNLVILIEADNNADVEYIRFDNVIVTGTGGSPDPEPTNHVTNFSSTANDHNQIDLTWIDATGDNLPAGYLIKANTTESFVDPVDGTDYTEDPDLSDGSAIVKVIYGIQTYNFIGLNESTQYFFKIWSLSNSGSDIDYKTDGTVPNDDATTDAAPELPSIVINEIHANPDATNGDANNDGTVSSTQDEFIEIFNNDNTSINISGWTISDETRVRHIFPANTVLQPKSAIVIFSGGTPTGSFGGAIVQTASTGSLVLNNNGDTVTIMNGTTTIVSYQYKSEGGDNQSITRNPDITGDFVKHSDIPPGHLYSPGMKNNGDQSLPITLSYFTATSQNATVIIEWKTESEVNNLGFNLHRSQDKNNYEKINKKLIKGAGTSSTANLYSFTDKDVVPGKTYNYKLEDISTAGKSKIHKTITITVQSIKNETMIIDDFQLFPAYPNPCNPSSTIQYNIPTECNVNINIYNLKGDLIKNLENTVKHPGQHKIIWNGKNNQNHQVGNGVYFFQLSTSTGFARTEKVVLLK